MGKIGRNDPCPCGSGKKYKKCCLLVERRKPWSLEEVRSLSTKEIVSRLGTMGIHITEENFLREVENFYSAYDLSEKWWKTSHVTARGFDRDFPWMAAVVLWERLAPHIINSEKLNDMMQEGYRLCSEGKEDEGCRIWLEVWEHLKKRFTPEMKSINDAEKVFSGLQNLFNWCQDLEMELGNAGLKEPSFYEKRIEYCREFCRLFPETDRLIIENMKRAEAESYFTLGMVEEGDRAFRDLVEEFPDSAWVYIGWGDMYWLFRDSKAPRDYDRAENIYRMALERNVDGREDVLERLQMLEEERTNETAV
ncbi:SEC-C metal-binding domain-containing protein [Desulfofundulus sp. TPOSR]|uniref:SEC-C motif domain protein n=1 Tax=Desulfofundulus kuznetsovii (strain DSM 6115 / VKM B-1805 / 17) TaxID=760568 RepID=A0AAU8PAF8_DESK7|nr:SEC-C metal-binding domain-containing protein [Desulfofundulus sp. TPOSR]AEG15629.1 SEC-C motif domain protein [Desulfofundulus kuznetsovii DSM 6115]